MVCEMILSCSYWKAIMLSSNPAATAMFDGSMKQQPGRGSEWYGILIHASSSWGDVRAGSRAIYWDRMLSSAATAGEMLLDQHRSIWDEWFMTLPGAWPSVSIPGGLQLLLKGCCQLPPLYSINVSESPQPWAYLKNFGSATCLNNQKAVQISNTGNPDCYSTRNEFQLTDFAENLC